MELCEVEDDGDGEVGGWVDDDDEDDDDDDDEGSDLLDGEDDCVGLVEDVDEDNETDGLVDNGDDEVDDSSVVGVLMVSKK